MVWEWSHTEQAYEDARLNVQDLSRKDLLIILREWRHKETAVGGKEGTFRLNYPTKHLSKDILADAVWDKMSELRNCDNGGWNAWCCPYGCHTVPFDRKGVAGGDVLLDLLERFRRVRNPRNSFQL